MRLTKYQKDYIKANYATMKSRDIAEALNIPYKNVHGYAQNNKLRKDGSKNVLSHCSWEYFLTERKLHQYNHIEQKTEPKVDNLYKSKYGKYHVNQFYFSKIDNEWKAYWLGFLYADGSITHTKRNGKRKDCMALSLANQDKSHLIKLQDSLQTDSPIKDSVVKLNGNEYCCSRLIINNRQIVEDLIKLGCPPRKSLTLQFPSYDIVPKHLMKHFIRGYFDGDGCIYININKKQVRFNMVGTQEFLNGLLDFLNEEIGIDKFKLRQKGKAFSYQVGNINQIFKIYQYLYKDVNIYLDRKFKKFNILYWLD